MASQQASNDLPKTSSIQRDVPVHVRRSWLLIARLGWAAMTLLTLVIFVASLSSFFAFLHGLNVSGAPDNRFGPIGQLTPGALRAFQMVGLSLDFYAWYQVMLRLVLLCAFVTVGIVLVHRTWGTPQEFIALLASCFLVLFPVTFNHVLFSLLPPAWTLLGNVLVLLGSLCLGFFFVLFPDGRFVPSWTPWLLVGWNVYWTVDIFFPSLQDGIYGWLLFAFLVFFIASLVWVQIYRYRRVSSAWQRQQTKWVVFGVIIAFGGYLIGSIILFGLLPGFFHDLGPFYSLLSYTFLTILVCLFPFFVAIAIVRSHLWDIDILIKRTLVYGVLTASIVGLYALVVGTLSTLLQTHGNFLISLVAAGLVAMLFHPLREQLQRLVSRLLYGQRDEPYTVLSQLGSHLQAALAPEQVLPTIVETIARALKLPYVAIVLPAQDKQAIEAAVGTPTEDVLRLPLHYQTEPVGQLLLAPRTPGEAFSPPDQRLLEDLARQAGVAVSTVRLTSDLRQLTHDLQRSRTHLVITREEERRRLRRDLHDGLGSVLTSLNWQTGAVRAFLRRDPHRAATLMEEQQHTIRAAIADIRRLVYDLRPPALDELGLLVALQERAAHYSAAPSASEGTTGLQISVQAQGELPALPAAVEVAVYRVVQEALANVARHAQARTCTVQLAVQDGGLQVEISDDGTGLDPNRRAGVGLVSMRERAAELEGTCRVNTRPQGGTVVRVFFPLVAATERAFSQEEELA